jgi:hypothetical protein
VNERPAALLPDQSEKYATMKGASNAVAVIARQLPKSRVSGAATSLLQ